MQKFFNNKICLLYSIVITVISLVDIMVYWTMRNSWYFINAEIENALGKRLPMDIIILMLLIISFTIIAVTTIEICFNKGLEDYKKLIIPTVLVVFFTVLVIALFQVLLISRDTLILEFKHMLPFVGIGALIGFLLFFYPTLALCKNRLFKYGTLVVLVITAFYFTQNMGKVEIVSGPYIQYTDNNDLAIMWTTNKNSTGYVDYGPSEDNLQRAFDTTNGVKNANTKIHRVIIPRSDSKDLVYKVGSVKVNNYYEYEAKYGNTVESSLIKVKSNPEDEEATFYILSDTHDNEDFYKEFLSKDDYDFVVLNGDVIDGVKSEELTVKNLLKPISKYTKGEKPIYLVRGNHEARGKEQGKLIEYLSLPANKYYYTFNYGPIYSIVIDSGEDAVDEDKKYSELSNFKGYVENQRQWVETLSQEEDYKNSLYKIAFLHIPLNDYEYTGDTSYLKDNQIALAKTFSDMNIQGVFSGHTHVPEIVEPNNISTYPIFIGGGEENDENYKESYLAIKVTANKEEMKVQYINFAGQINQEYIIKPQGLKK